MAQPRRVSGSVWLVLAWGCAAAVVVGFVLPWAYIDLREPGALKALREQAPASGALGDLSHRVKRVTVTVRRGAEQVTGELPSLKDIPTQVSGLQIPQLANQENAKVALALMDLLLGEQQQVGLKSYVVYLLPLLALAAAGALTGFARSRACGVAVAVLCAAIAAAGFWKLLTTDTQALFVAITIGPGLWISLAAYAILAIAALLQILVGRRRPAD